MDFTKMSELLKAEVKPALGCTGPIGVSYAAAEARDAVGGTPKKIKIFCDKDTAAKNDDVGIPGTSVKGLKMAAALGAIAGDASAKLEVLNKVTADDEKVAYEFSLTDQCIINPDWETPTIGFYVEAEVETENGIGRAVVAKTHSKLVYKEANGKVLYNENLDRSKSLDESHDFASTITVDDVFEFVTKVPLEEIAWLREGIDMNRAMAQASFDGKTGVGLGKSLLSRSQGDLIRKAKAYTAAGSEARMCGYSLPIMTCATSGNAGITSTLALLSMSEDLGKTEEELIRSVAMACLTTVIVKNRIGRHSAMCACVVGASLGVAAGAALMLGGGLKEVNMAVNNTIVNVIGVVCDGARAACGLKLGSASGIAIEGALLAMDGVCVPPDEGIAGVDAKASIDFMGRFAKTGMIDLDRVLCQALYAKHHEL